MKISNVIFIITLASFGLIAQENISSPILPSPSFYMEDSEMLSFNQLTIDTNNVNQNTVNFLSKELKKIWGIELIQGGANSLIQFQIDPIKGNGYTLEIKDKITVFGVNDEAQFHGAVSLLQLIEQNSNGYSIQEALVKDEAKFEWRGLHLDVSRHFFTVEEVKRFIDAMTYYKFNKFHWHLTDDQGWRIEIKRYPKLTSIGGQREGTMVGHYSDSPRIFDSIPYSGFYTQEEIRDVVRYAKSRFIEVVPEIELPGHSRAALAAYPEYSCTGNKNPVPQIWGIFDEIYCSKDETIEFMQNILAEVLELFPSEYIHIGGDEAPKTMWKGCNNCQRVMKENGLENEQELQSYFIGKMDKFLTANGRKLIGWDEILEGGLSPNAAVMSWRGEKGGIAAAQQGHYVVMTPTTYCYFDYYQSTHAMEPIAIGGYLPLEKVYKFDPIPKSLTAKEAKFIMGGQANLWTEYILDYSQLEYMTYPRAVALSQCLWSINKPSYESFLSVYLGHHEAFFRKIQLNFAKSIHYPAVSIKRTPGGIKVKFEGVKGDAPFKIDTYKEEFSDKLNPDQEQFYFLKRSQLTKPLPQIFALNSKDFDKAIKYNFINHSAIGINIDLITPPHPKYNNNGSLNLVDGIFGSTPWKGSEWLGFQDSTVSFILDLEKKQDIQGISIGFLKQNGSWIYLPKSMTMLTSNDKVNWVKTNNNDSVKLQMKEGRCITDFSANTQYIKVVIQSIGIIPEGNEGGGHKPWTFIDEIQIIKGE